MILDQFRLDGKVALVTGGSRGLGFAMAAALAEAGADIISIQHASHPEALAGQITSTGRRFLLLPLASLHLNLTAWQEKPCHGWHEPTWPELYPPPGVLVFVYFYLPSRKNWPIYALMALPADFEPPLH